MAEPEGLLIEAAHRVVTLAGRLRRSDPPPDPQWRLDHHRDRLRLLMAAACGREHPIRVAEPPAPPTLLARLMKGLPRDLVETQALPATDGVSIFLPARLTPLEGLQPGRLFRLLALQQGVRAGRLAGIAPPPPGLRRALFLLCEALAADRALAAAFPGLAQDIAALRGSVPAQRPARAGLTSQERALERLYRQLLSAPAQLAPCAATPAESLEWADDTARSITWMDGTFRGLPGDLWWGALRAPPAAGAVMPPSPEPDPAPARPRVGRMARRPRVREAEEGEDDERPGAWMIQSDDPLEHAEDPRGLQRNEDQGDSDPDDLGDSLSELPEARLVPAEKQARELLQSDDPPDGHSIQDGPPTVPGAGITYPEWDWRREAYRDPGAWVQVRDLTPGDSRWAEGVLARRRALLGEVRRRFERLRPRRLILPRQNEGDEVDLDACVTAFADRRAAGALDERLYRRVRPARRGVAVSLLLDVSGSTDAWVTGHLRVIDVAKEALLLVCHALDALGDPYSVLTFCSRGPRAVILHPIKGFAEHDRTRVARRIAALEPDGHTRTGAALRHATALLEQRREPHRLLLLLSDGKPNDEDRYAGPYGVEDTRRAVIEARLSGIHCFCLTVDRRDTGGLPRLFGPGGYSVLRHPEQLPAVLVQLLQHVLTG